MVMKSFRGRLADDSKDTIPLSTNNGSIGYRVTKFIAMGTDANSNTESVMKLYSIPQSTVTTDIDFSDNTLLGAIVFNSSADNAYNPEQTVIFDNIIFNQDIVVTLKGHQVAQTLNYYIELEQMKLDINENTVATLKDIKNIEATYL